MKGRVLKTFSLNTLSLTLPPQGGGNNQDTPKQNFEVIF
jgi:hypothetical protein